MSRDSAFRKAEKLREQGLAPLVWEGSLGVMRAHGINVESHPEAETGVPKNSTMGSRLWAPRWAVLVVEADPCNEQAKEWALKKAMREEEFRDALDSIARLIGRFARQKMADFIMEQWNPEE